MHLSMSSHKLSESMGCAESSKSMTLSSENGTTEPSKSMSSSSEDAVGSSMPVTIEGLDFILGRSSEFDVGSEADGDDVSLSFSLLGKISIQGSGLPDMVSIRSEVCGKDVDEDEDDDDEFCIVSLSPQ